MSLLAAGALTVGCSGEDDSESAGGSALSNEGTTASDLIEQGLAAHVEGDLDEAEDLYRQVLDMEPENAYAHYNLGLIAQTSEEPTLAEEHYHDALAIAPSMPSAAYNLAILRTEDGAFDEAIKLYQQVLTQEPDAAAHFNLGLLLQQQGRTQEANRELKTAAKLDPALADRVEAALSEGDAEGEAEEVAVEAEIGR